MSVATTTKQGGKQVDVRAVERLTAVETDMQGLRTEVGALTVAVRELAGKFAESQASGKWTVQGIVGVLGALASWSVALSLLIWFVVDLSNEPTRKIQAMMLEDYRDHKENHGHPAVVAELAGVKSQLVAEKVETDAQNDRLKRLEEWYNGHGQRMAEKVLEVSGEVDTLRGQVQENATTIRAQDGIRFTMDDYDRMVAPVVKRVEGMEASRWTLQQQTDWRRDVDKFNQMLMERISHLEAAAGLKPRHWPERVGDD